MTVRELYEYLMQCDDSGFGKAEVIVCDNRDNPLTYGICIESALRIEENNGEKTVILQTG